MSKKRTEPKIFHNKELMNEFNDIMIRIKLHLFEFNDLKSSDKISPLEVPKPTVKELDELMSKIFDVLKKDSEPYVKK